MCKISFENSIIVSVLIVVYQIMKNFGTKLNSILVYL